MNGGLMIFCGVYASYAGAFPQGVPEKGEDERLAREALVRVLQSPEPLSRTLRDRLAELFRPRSKFAERQLVFKRRRGRPTVRSPAGRAVCYPCVYPERLRRLVEVSEFWLST
jgi:hypothetical protein